MKRKFFWLAIFAAISISVLFGASSFLHNSQEGEGLPAGVNILARTEIETRAGIFLGQEFAYRLRIISRSGEVSVDDRGLEVVDLKPFEIRSRKVFSGKNGDFQEIIVEWKLQGVKAQPKKLYEFSPILVKYQERGEEKFLSVYAEPIFVSSLLPADLSENTALEPKPAKNKIVDFHEIKGYGLLMIAAIILFVGLMSFRKSKSVLREEKRVADPILLEFQEELEKISIAFSRYGASPRESLAGIYISLRKFLVNKTGNTWFSLSDERFDSDSASREMNEIVISLRNLCWKAYGREDVAREEAREALTLANRLAGLFLAQDGKNAAVEH